MNSVSLEDDWAFLIKEEINTNGDRRWAPKRERGRLRLRRNLAPGHKVRLTFLSIHSMSDAIVCVLQNSFQNLT